MEDVIGLFAAFLTTISFLPQVLKIYKTKQTKDISLFMYVIFFFGVSLWLVYGIMIAKFPVIAANAVTLIFVTIVLIYKIKYKS